MSRAHLSRFAVRDRGLRRARTVTAWSAAGSAGLAIAAAIALVPAAATPASGQAGADDRVTGPAPADDRATPGATSRPSRTPAAGSRPHARRTTRALRLAPPTTPPATARSGGQHATSGGS